VTNKAPYRHFCRSGNNQKSSTQKWNVERAEELDVFRPTDSGLHPSQAFSVLSWHQSGKILSLLSISLYSVVICMGVVML
jgi:hypothetical protein